MVLLKSSGILRLGLKLSYPSYPCELWMILLLDKGWFSVWVVLGLGLLCLVVASPRGLRLRGDVRGSPPATADLATDST